MIPNLTKLVAKGESKTLELKRSAGELREALQTIPEHRFAAPPSPRARAETIACDFPTFFQALWGYDPLPWQEMLAGRTAVGRWPQVLDLSTASGKTARIGGTIHVLASRSHTPPVCSARVQAAGNELDRSRRRTRGKDVRDDRPDP
jgi:hypothetical protein